MDAHGFVLPTCPTCGAPMNLGDMRCRRIEATERVPDSGGWVRFSTMRVGCKVCLPTPLVDELEQIHADFGNEDLNQDAAALGWPAYVLAGLVARHYRELADLPLRLRGEIHDVIEALRCAGEGRQQT